MNTKLVFADSEFSLFHTFCKEIVNSRRTMYGKDGSAQVTIDYLCNSQFFAHCLREALGESCSSSINGIPHLQPVKFRESVFEDNVWDYEDAFGIPGSRNNLEYNFFYRTKLQDPYIHRRPPAKILFEGLPLTPEVRDENNNVVYRGSKDEPVTWLYASKVLNTQALSPEAPPDPTVFFEHLDQKSIVLKFPLNYKVIKFTLSFEHKSYKILTDQDVLSSSPDRVEVSDISGQSGSNVRPLRYISRYLLPVAKFEKIPMGKMFWVPDGTPETNIRENLLRGSELVYSWHEVPTCLKQELRIQRYLGTVNKYTFDRFPAGTLRLDGMSMKTYRPYHGNLLTDFSLFVNHVDRKPQVLLPDADEDPFDLKGYGHNYVTLYGTERADNDLRIRYVADVNLRPPYPEADWSFIFLPYDEE